ncbi:MAG: hypothetical protein HZA10_06090 [Nitrospirae bacterium]|nr:hypothetical protein [Nitrospirota bacterium]
MHKSVRGRRCSIVFVFISLSLFIRIMQVCLRYNSLEIVYWKANFIAEHLVALLTRVFPRKITARRLACSPNALPAKELCDENGNNLRERANDTVIQLAKKIVSSNEHRNAFSSLVPGLSAGLFVPAYIEFRIAQEIEAAVYLAFYILSRQAKSKTDDKEEFILFVPANWWGKELAVYLREMPFAVIVGGGYPGFTSWYAEKIFNKIFLNKSHDNNLVRNKRAETQLPFIAPFLGKISTSGAPHKIFGYYIATSISDGISPDMRNNLNWAWGRALSPAHLAGLWENDYRQPTDAEFELAGRLQMKVHGRRRGYAGTEEGSFPLWKPTGLYYEIILTKSLKLLGLFLINIILFSRKRLWTYVQTAFLLKGVAWWYDYFMSNSIKVYVEDAYGAEIYQRAVAMEMAGGINALVERSMVYSNHSYYDDRPANVSFLSGSYSLSQVIDPDKAINKVISGYYHDQMDSEALSEQVNLLKDKLKDMGAFENGPLIAVFDEPGFIYGRDVIFDFYRTLFNDMEERGGYSVVIKPKKEKFFSRMPADILKGFKSLVEKRRCFILDPFTTVTLSSKVADMAVSLPSTAMFTSICCGKRTAVFNPLRTIRGIFYQQNLKNICIFDSMPLLLGSLHKHIEGGFDGFGDCSAVHEILDPFMDSASSERISECLRWCLEGFEAGLSREDVIAESRRRYSEKWGSDKVV